MHLCISIVARAFAIAALAVGIIATGIIGGLPNNVTSFLLSPIPILVVGCFCAATAVAYSTSRILLERTTDEVRFVLMYSSAFVVWVVVFFFSLYIILNIRGA
jgi:hypothetical protein